MDKIPTQDELEAYWNSPAKDFRGVQTTARTYGTIEEISHISEQGDLSVWVREVGETEWKLVGSLKGKFDAQRS